MNQPDPERLERLFREGLRRLPDREAPGTLEARVFAAIEQRAATPAWRRSYTHWPRSLRYAFILLLTVGTAALFALGRSDVPARVVGEMALRFSSIAFLQSIGTTLAGTVDAVLGAIPPGWVLGATTLLVGSYALVLGLGAAAYRTFFKHGSFFRPISQ